MTVQKTPIIVGLDTRTKKAMYEVFGGKRCCECNKPAHRFTEHRNKKGKSIGTVFYCFECYAKDPEPIVFTEKKVITHPSQVHKVQGLRYV